MVMKIKGIRTTINVGIPHKMVSRILIRNNSPEMKVLSGRDRHSSPSETCWRAELTRMVVALPLLLGVGTPGLVPFAKRLVEFG